MEFEYTGNRIIFNRVLSKLDDFVIRFTTLLDNLGIKYVIVSGYVSIVFGRSRQTEDIDLLIEPLSYEKFEMFWKKMEKSFECMNTSNKIDAYKNYFNEKTALRFFAKNQPIPNIEFKITSDADDKYTLENSITLVLNKKLLAISPIEFQIAYKMRLGSEKDFEDAKHLFNLFKPFINSAKLIKFLKLFDVKERPIKEYLKGL